MTVKEPAEKAWLALPRETFLMLVSNLLSNACKYTKSGDRISVQAAVDSGLFSLAVEDTGGGIPVGREECIFDWFKRGDSRTEIDGWGIGLALSVKQLRQSAALSS